MNTESEQIVLLDEAHKAIGAAPKLASHHSDTPLHLAFSCYIFDGDGRFLLTQRALSKKVWPGVWTNSVCGHPAPGEQLVDAVRRRAAYELGISELSEITEMLPDYTYRTPPFNGIIENEFCPVFVAQLPAGAEFTPNPDEVEAYEWVDWESLPGLVTEDSDKYSYWLKDQLAKLRAVINSNP